MPRQRQSQRQRPGRAQRRSYLVPAIPVQAEQFDPSNPPQNVWQQGGVWIIDVNGHQQEIEAGDWIIDLPNDTQQVWRAEDWSSSGAIPAPRRMT